jgi:hypothetical protein
MFEFEDGSKAGLRTQCINDIHRSMSKERTMLLNNLSAVWITGFGFVGFAILFQLEMLHP